MPSSRRCCFSAAGIVIDALHDEHNIFRMGGLRKQLPVAFWAFLIAGCSLAGLPLITAGFFSKDLIIWGAWSGANGAPGFWIVALVGVLLTSLYTFRHDLPGVLRRGAKPGDASGLATR